jgi:hypothetical protein
MYSYLVCDVVMTLNKRGVAVLMEMGEKRKDLDVHIRTVLGGGRAEEEARPCP